MLMLAGLFTIVIPIRAWGLKRRYGVAMVFVGMIMAVAAAPPSGTTGVASPGYASSGYGSEPQSTGYKSSGGCKTDALGVFKCDSQASFGSYKSESSMVCKKNPFTDQQECKWETR